MIDATHLNVVAGLLKARWEQTTDPAKRRWLEGKVYEWRQMAQIAEDWELKLQFGEVTGYEGYR